MLHRAKRLITHFNGLFGDSILAVDEGNKQKQSRAFFQRDYEGGGGLVC